MPLFGRSKRTKGAEEGEKFDRYDAPVDASNLSKAQIKRATRTRTVWTVISALCLFIAVIFLILVEAGNTSNKPALRDIWFIRLDVSQIIPTSIPGSGTVSSVAVALGLYEFYQVGLWNDCEGWFATGVAGCAPTTTMYWVNPVTLITEHLVAGATVDIPTDITDSLDLIRIASHWMFGLFLTGACLTFFLIPFLFFGLYSRWVSLFLMVFTLLNAVIVTAASVVATVLFIVMRNVLQSHTSEINIGATVGTTMFALMWVAAALTLFAFLIQLSLLCCCASRRDVRSGRKRGSKKAYRNSTSSSSFGIEAK